VIFLETKNATMRFGGVTAVDDLNLQIEEGSIVAIIGPNGAGKTTAFNMITGVYTPTSGQIFLKSKTENKQMDITGKRPDQIAALGLSRTFQNVRLFSKMSVLDNVLIANHMHVKSGIFESLIGWPRYYKEEREIRKRSMELLDLVGLADVADSLATSLPYGSQRKLEIARALATKPELLLLDEPAAGMNPQETQELTYFIREIRDTFDLTILLIEHHMQVVMEISDVIYVLDFGKTIAQGSPDDVKNDEKVIEAYLGVDRNAENR
jgi:branched-chain amino acid transport system ATP-binding protein